MDKNYPVDDLPPSYPGGPSQPGFHPQGGSAYGQQTPLNPQQQPTVYVQQQQPVIVPIGVQRGVGFGGPVVHVAGTYYGSRPANTTCPHCGAQIITQTEATPGLKTWVICGVLAFVGCIFGCCLIPFCIPDCQDVKHRCPNCKTYLGSNHAM